MPDFKRIRALRKSGKSRYEIFREMQNESDDLDSLYKAVAGFPERDLMVVGRLINTVLLGFVCVLVYSALTDGMGVGRHPWPATRLTAQAVEFFLLGSGALLYSLVVVKPSVYYVLMFVSGGILIFMPAITACSILDTYADYNRNGLIMWNVSIVAILFLSIYGKRKIAPFLRLNKTSYRACGFRFRHDDPPS